MPLLTYNSLFSIHLTDEYLWVDMLQLVISFVKQIVVIVSSIKVYMELSCSNQINNCTL